MFPGKLSLALVPPQQAYVYNLLIMHKNNCLEKEARGKTNSV